MLNEMRIDHGINAEFDENNLLKTERLERLMDSNKRLCDMARLYQTDTKVIEAMDRQYGGGSCDYIGRAIEAFYKK